MLGEYFERNSKLPKCVRTPILNTNHDHTLPSPFYIQSMRLSLSSNNSITHLQQTNKLITQYTDYNS